MRMIELAVALMLLLVMAFTILFRFNKTCRFWCARHRRGLAIVSCLCFLTVLCIGMAGCAVPVWLEDADNMLPVLLQSVLGLISLIGAFTGAGAAASVLADINNVAGLVSSGITELETLIKDYNASPSDTLLQKVEAAGTDITSNLKGILALIPGLPTALASKISALVNLLIEQLEAWLSLIPAASKTVAAGTVVTIKIPFSKKEFELQFNQIVGMPTGDAETDAALAVVKKF